MIWPYHLWFSQYCGADEHLVLPPRPKRKEEGSSAMTEKVDLILVPTDFSPLSCEAFAWAGLFAKGFRAKILILHVISESAAEDMISIPDNPWEDILEREDTTMIEGFSACLASDFDESLTKETLVAVGSAAPQIIEVAKKRNASMIVMATHGRTGLAHALIGSVAEKVIRLAPCPVLSVKPKTIRQEHQNR